MGRGPLLTVAEKGEIWMRGGRGEPVWMIARHMGRSRRAVRDHVTSTGGVPPHKPQRSRHELTIGEREAMSSGLAVGATCKAMAARMGRAPSSVSREVRRNGGRER